MTPAKQRRPTSADSRAGGTTHLSISPYKASAKSHSQIPVDQLLCMKPVLHSFTLGDAFVALQCYDVLYGCGEDFHHFAPAFAVLVVPAPVL
mmetsp:Transcript_82482/g.250115  ORF Transcript_82482/g.250115 Transcript_82482/m.250115 type:complete len:92 (-) Transcript_82482:508-783(-)